MHDEDISATIKWLHQSYLTDKGGDYGFPLDSAMPFDAVLSLPVQRGKKRARDELKVICDLWKQKSAPADAAHTITDGQWVSLKDKNGRIFADIRRLPADAIAFYRPFHLEPFEAWGIYVFLDRLLTYGQNVRLQLPIFGDVSETVFLHLVLFEMFHHEFFHHVVESAATTIEILTSALGVPVPSYLEYRMKTRSRGFAWHNHQPLEEALANAYAYNSLGFISRVKAGFKDYVVQLYQAVL